MASPLIVSRFHGDHCLLHCSFPFPTFPVRGQPSQKTLGWVRRLLKRLAGYQQVSPSIPAKTLCQRVARTPLPGVPQCVPNKPRYWNDGEVKDRVRHGETDQKWARDSGLHSP